MKTRREKTHAPASRRYSNNDDDGGGGGKKKGGGGGKTDADWGKDSVEVGGGSGCGEDDETGGGKRRKAEDGSGIPTATDEKDHDDNKAEGVDVKLRFKEKKLIDFRGKLYLVGTGYTRGVGKCPRVKITQSGESAKSKLVLMRGYGCARHLKLVF